MKMKFEEMGLTELTEEDAMDFINGKYAAPDPESFGEDVEAAIVQLNKMLMDDERFTSMNTQKRVHLFECLTSYCLCLCVRYSNLDPIEQPEELAEVIKNIYLKMFAYYDELSTMESIHKELFEEATG